MNLFKKEQFDILKQLVAIEDILLKAKSFKVEVLGESEPVLYVDQERYLEMAIRIDPTDGFLIYRKTEYQSIVKVKIFDSRSNSMF